MKILLSFLLATLFSSTSFAQLNTKLIASKYGKGVVKIILFDTQKEKEKPGTGYLSRGSGFFVTSDGYIFTNRHVVETCVKGYLDYDYKDKTGKTKAGFSSYSEAIVNDKSFVKAYRTGYTVPIIQVFYGNSENDYKLYNAKVIAISMGAFDGAMLKVTSDAKGNTKNFNFTHLPLGNSDNVQQGEQLCVFGYPAQIRGSETVMLRDMSTLSTGIMSGFDFNINKDYGFIKTDAEIHPGNSGGPVFNEENKVIGIATAKGTATGIGLVGGLNGMYYVSATDAASHEKLIAQGLKIPKRSFSINTITGNKQPIKSVKDINASVVSTTSTSYKNAFVYFSNVSKKNNNNKLPSPSQKYSSFKLDRKKGRQVWIYVDNYPTPMNSSQIIVLVDKLTKGKYVKFKDLVYNITSTIDYTYFSFDFKETGKFRFSVYSKEKVFISSGIVELTK